MKFQIKTSQETEIIDITEKIDSRIDGEDGICTVFVPHTTAGLTVNENEDRLLEDIKEFIKEAVPEKDYRHDGIDDNASAHLRNLLLDSNVTLPVKNGEIQTGNWQSILFIELDGPRTRTVKLEVTR